MGEKRIQFDSPNIATISNNIENCQKNIYSDVKWFIRAALVGPSFEPDF